MTHSEKKLQQITKQIPALGRIPEQDRLDVFKRAFKNGAYKFLLFIVVLLFVLVFYLNFDKIIDYDGPDSGGMIGSSLHFLKEIGLSFFLPLMGVFAVLIFGRNYFVNQEIKKYEEEKRN